MLKSLGWEEFGLTHEKTNRLLAEGESRALPFHEQLVAYAGWLVTNPTFMDEVAALKQQEEASFATGLNLVTSENSRAINAFLGRWQLAGMSTWDLPEPQGPNLASIKWPESAQHAGETVNLELPLTTRLPARFPIRELVAEIREQAAKSHLLKWLEILDRVSKESLGLQAFRHMLHIRFFRDIVVVSRYGNRFDGNVQALDRAFGHYLGVRSEDSVKKLRAEIRRRLSSAASNA
jgi:hypothetical protein